MSQVNNRNDAEEEPVLVPSENTASLLVRFPVSMLISPPNDLVEVTVLSCVKVKIDISPLQIVDYAKIRDKSMGSKFINLKKSIQINGFMNISTVWGILFEPGKCSKQIIDEAGLSPYRLRMLNEDQSILLLIDGAQRTEAITQLMEEKILPENMLIMVEVPDPIKYANHSWSYPQVV